jgi:hypothetical protein
MATSIGKMYARLIHGGMRTFPEGVPEIYHEQTIEAWAELFPSEPPLVGVQ